MVNSVINSFTVIKKQLTSFTVATTFLLSLPLTFSVHAKMTTSAETSTSPALTLSKNSLNADTKKVSNSSAGIRLSDGTLLTEGNNTTSSNNPLEIEEETIANIEILVPNSDEPIALKKLLTTPYKYQQSDDTTVTRTLMVNISDSDGNKLKSDTIDGCKHYIITLIDLDNNRYTQKRDTPYIATTYYLKPKQSNQGKPHACYAKPNMIYSGNNSSNFKNRVNGPTSQWNSTNGFILQDLNNPSSNFPTVGAHGLFFNLSFINADAKTVQYEKIPANSGIDLSINNIDDQMVKVMLTGPRNGATVSTASTAVPTLFTIKAGDTPIYTFKISKWFITLADSAVYYDEPYNNCQNLYGSSYRIPIVNEYTNANNSDYYKHTDWSGGLPGQPNNYQRRIGGGLFSEWGDVGSGVEGLYDSSDFAQKAFYWATESYNWAGTLWHRVIRSDNGYVTSSSVMDSANRLACVTP
ncbi:hypothetical protein PT276_03570 [Orbaceae bacterium ESL0721]|nr:hypothetical protein [Orbaceae bacterium ESL0721]